MASLSTNQGSGSPPEQGQVLPALQAPAVGRADAWDELNHLDDTYLEFSTASDIPRGILLVLGLLCAGFIALDLSLVARSLQQEESFLGLAMLFLPSLVLLLIGGFMLRLDLRLPQDRPVRFNRKQGRVYVNEYTWNHNPFGRWGGRAKVLDWSAMQARIVRRVGASGELATQRHDLELIAPLAAESVAAEVVRLQRGAVTTRQYEEQWEFIRLYMRDGLNAVPPQPLRNPTPGVVDCILFAMPWFAPTIRGRQVRSRMKFGYWCLAILMSLLFPLWLLFGLGNLVVTRLAPKATWPAGMDEQSRRSVA